ncbi:hypothetical protein H8S31_01430 [Escherichia coli]|uniref:hypothetical protein n=1 Tax=Escherichia coli TaxID=562 RepID=UPI0016399766|nr:hypothetical protein [Escherichia coli]MBK1592165.1 hypothetical protein [Escherichia coli]
MEAFKNLLNQLEIQKAEQRQREAEEATKQNELRKAQADLSEPPRVSWRVFYL